MKKKKKKQEPIFSALEEIRIEKTEKNFFEQTIIPCEIKGPEEKTTFFQPETIAIERSEINLSFAAPATFVAAPQEVISPASEGSEDITIPGALERAPVVTPESSAETLVSPTVSLTAEQEAISPVSEQVEEVTIHRLSEPAAVDTPETPAEILSSPAGSLSDEQKISAPITTPVLPDFSFAFISPGSFIMGSPETESGRSDDELPHEVSITQGLFIQTTPVTQGQWKAVMGNNPSRFSTKGDDNPVESVSWYDCQKFIERLNSIGGHTYRLPTEAEWEYACRAGKFSSCSEGEISELFCDHDSNLDAAGWYCGNSDRTTHPIARKKPNPWGIYDFHGNVLEWCQDWYGTYPATSQTDPSGPITGPGRVIRGGSWFSNAKSCRSAARFHWSPNAKSDFIGFRLVRER